MRLTLQRAKHPRKTNNNNQRILLTAISFSWIFCTWRKIPGCRRTRYWAEGCGLVWEWSACLSGQAWWNPARRLWRGSLKPDPPLYTGRSHGTAWKRPENRHHISHCNIWYSSDIWYSSRCQILFLSTPIWVFIIHWNYTFKMEKHFYFPNLQYMSGVLLI